MKRLLICIKSYLSSLAIPFFFIVLAVVILGSIPVFILVLKYDPGLSNAYVAFGTLTLALVTGVLAFFTWWSIRNSNEKEKRDRNEHLLNEIIEWAEAVAKYSLEKGVFDESIPVSGLQAEHVLPELLDSVIGFRIARARSVYTSNIASEIDPELKKSIDNLIEEIKAQIKLIMEYKRKLTPTWPADQVVAKIAGNNELIYNLATIVIDEATKIKIRDIGKKEESMSKEGETTASNNEPTMKDIEKHLTRIEGHVIQSKKNAKAQAAGSFGFTGMAAGMALVATGVQTTSGLALFSVGLIVTLCSFYVKRT